MEIQESELVELRWRKCAIQKVEGVVQGNESKPRFDALHVEIQWEVLGVRVNPDELLDPDVHVVSRVSELVRDIVAKSSSSSLLSVLIHVASFIRQGGFDSTFIRYSEMNLSDAMAEVAAEVGLPAEEMPALKKGIDDAIVHESFSELITLSAAIKEHGNNLKGFRLSYSIRGMPAKLSASSFQELCSTLSKLPHLRELIFDRIDLVHDSKLMDAVSASIRESAAPLRTLRLLNTQTGSSGWWMVGLADALASPECQLETLQLLERKMEREGFDCLLHKLGGLKRLEIWLDETGEQVLARAAAGSALVSLKELKVVGALGDEKFELFYEALQGRQFLHLQCLELESYEIMTDGSMTRLANALQSPGCSVQRLCMTVEVDNKGLEWLMGGFMRALSRSKVQELQLELVKRPKDPSEAPSEAYRRVGEALKYPHCKLTALKLAFQNRGAPKCEIPQAFFDALQQAPALTKLGILDEMTPGDEARLGSGLKHSRLVALGCARPFVHDDLYQGMLASNIRSLEIAYVGEDDDQALEKLCEKILGNPDCQLQSLKIESLGIWKQKRLLEALDRNYRSRLQKLHLDWESDELELKCGELLQRNSLFQAASIGDREPNLAKLFLCGPSRAGKTTLSKNITRTLSLERPTVLQRYPASEIEMSLLTFEKSGKQLLICDMADFHHFFVPRIYTSMFLIVLKVDQRFKKKALRKDLEYWLRFTVSHSKQKPKVFIAINFFHERSIYEALLVATEVLQHYDGQILDINVENDIVQVKATQIQSLQGLKWELGKSLDTLLSRQSKVPSLCEVAKDHCIHLMKRKQKVFEGIVPIVDVLDIILARNQSRMATTLGDNDKNDIIKFIFLFLHDMGEVVYFDMQHLPHNYAILDVNWFFTDVIKLFLDAQNIPSEGDRQEQSEQSLHAIADKLHGHCGGEWSKVEFLFQCLYEMGVLIPMDDGWKGRWDPLPEKVVVPALLANISNEAPFKENVVTGRHWGRRLQCKHLKYTLFPSGIFSMLQARIHAQFRNPSIDVGSGWLKLSENKIGVYLRIGGETDSWTDRQWVEVMFWAAQDDRGKAVEEIMNKIKICIVQVCFGKLEIGEEKVLRSSYVRWRMHKPPGAEIPGTRQLDSPQVAAPLSEIEKQAQEHGLGYFHTWTGNEAEELDELLLPSEKDKYISKRTELLISVRADYDIVKAVYGTPELAPIPAIPGDFESQDSEKIIRYMRDLFMNQNHQRMEGKLDRLQQELEVMGKQVLEYSSRILHSINVEDPRHPYLASQDEDGTFRWYRYGELCLHESVKIRYLCEYEKGSHPVDNVEGVVVKLQIDWLKKWAPVLIPALVVLFIGIKVGATFAGVGGLDSIVKLIPKTHIMDFIKGNMELETLDVKALKEMKPTRKDIEDVFAAVRQASGATTREQIKRMVHKSLGLQWNASAGAWLCDEHHSSSSQAATSPRYVHPPQNISHLEAAAMENQETESIENQLQENELRWRKCGIREVEQVLKANERKPRFEALDVEIDWNVLGVRVYNPDELWITGGRVSSDLVREIVAKSSSSSLLSVLIHVAALIFDSTFLRFNELERTLIEGMVQVAKEVGLPAEEMPALEKGIGDAMADERFSALLTLSATIKEHGNNLKGFRLSSLNWIPAKLSASSFQELCSTLSKLPHLRELTFERIDLVHDSKLMDAVSASIRESAAPLRTLRFLDTKGGSTRWWMEALGNTLASPECQLETLQLLEREMEREGFDCLLHKLGGLKRLETFLDDAGAQVIARATAGSAFVSLKELKLIGALGDENFELFYNALQGGQFRQLQCLELKSYEKMTDGSMKRLANALQTGCPVQRLCMTVEVDNKGLERLMRALSSSKVLELQLELIKWPKDRREAYRSLGEMLKNPDCKLTALTLDFQNHQREIPQAFFDGLKQAQALTKLGILDEMTPEDEARLGSCLKQSRLVALGCGRPFVHDDLYQGMLASNIRRLTIASVGEDDDQALEELCKKILSNPDSQLQSLEFGSFQRGGIWKQKQVLEALATNYRSRLQELKMHMGWKSDEMEDRCSELLRRNSVNEEILELGRGFRTQPPKVKVGLEL